MLDLALAKSILWIEGTLTENIRYQIFVFVLYKLQLIMDSETYLSTKTQVGISSKDDSPEAKADPAYLLCVLVNSMLKAL